MMNQIITSQLPKIRHIVMDGTCINNDIHIQQSTPCYMETTQYNSYFIASVHM